MESRAPSRPRASRAKAKPPRSPQRLDGSDADTVTLPLPILPPTEPAAEPSAESTREPAAESAPAAAGGAAAGASSGQSSAPSADSFVPDPVTDPTLEIPQAVIKAVNTINPPEPDEPARPFVSNEELSDLHSSREFIQLLREKNFDTKKLRAAIQYEHELECLQIELVKMQRWIQDNGKRLAVLFEGRDAAGKGGTIRRFTEHLNPRAMRVVALPKPTIEEAGQWYFQRYMQQLPNRGEIVFFDRSWYNRAVVEPVNGFCTQDQYERFMRQVPEFEHMLVEDGVMVVKFWFSMSKGVQLNRFESRKENPLKHWKLSPLDEKAQELWDAYTKFKEVMFSRTHTSFSPWIIVKANNKREARLESMRYVLSIIDYHGKDSSKVSLFPDPNVVTRFHRAAIKID